MARLRHWRSPEARALAAAGGVTDPEMAVCALVDRLLVETEQTTAPVNLQLVASFRGIAGITRMRMSEAANIAPTPNGLWVCVNDDDSSGRQNFSICHEICHTLFPRFRDNPTVKDAETGVFSNGTEEEWLCDIGASRLLLPPKLLTERASGYGPSIESVIRLSEEFGASLEATAIAWIGLGLSPVAVVFFEERLKPLEVRMQTQLALPTMEEEMRAEPKLRVNLACIPSSMSLFIPRHKSVRRDGPIYASLAARGRNNGEDVLDLRTGPAAMETDSLYAPFRLGGVLHHRVISLVRLR